LYPYRDISSALRASKVISRRLGFDRAGDAALTNVDDLLKTYSVTTNAAVPATVAIAARRVILLVRIPSKLVRTPLRVCGMLSATANARKCAVSNAVVKRGPWFDAHDLIKMINANLESTKMTRTTAAFVTQSRMRSRDALRYQSAGAVTAVNNEPTKIPTTLRQ
jgi:hypothetical protein